MTPQVHEIVDMLTKAFSADPCMATLTGLVGGEVYVAESTDPAVKIVGFAVWYAPGCNVDEEYVLDHPTCMAIDDQTTLLIGQYGLCRQQSRRSGGAAVWSIAEALPGVAAYEEMHAPRGTARSGGECIA
ncbi:hypothetical protein B0H14DRAFT_3895047 [Mycena olivaceomarginata]|nr:hypothetical protein B0H14DRAFT_3895047 [Mycena olivaceomarginata]